MRVLTSATGNVTHLDGREHLAEYADSPARVVPAEGPVCNSIGAARGNVRWYVREAKEVTCKRCLAALERAHADAITEDALRTATANARAVLAEVEEELSQPCGQCGSPRSSHRHNSAEGHAFVEPTVPAAEEDEPLGMYVELSSGLTEYVERGYRLQHSRSGERGTVTAVGPNAVDLAMDEGGHRSGASWHWDRVALPEAGKTTASPVPEHKLYTPTGEAVVVLGSAVHGNGLRAGVWVVRESRPLALAFFVDEEHLRLQFSAYRPGERARLADAARVATPLTTPSQVAALLASMSEEAERYASGGVTGTAAQEFGASMERWTAELARWLGMSEPVKLASYASPYGGPEQRLNV